MQPVRRHSRARLWASYPLRMMVSVAASILVVTLLFHLPLGERSDRSGWGRAGRTNQELLGILDIREPTLAYAWPVANTGVEDSRAEAQEIVAETEPETLQREPLSAALSDIWKMPALDFAERMPDIAGGIGAFYIHIDYPEQARIRGIEGRLVLLFVVETDGATNEIEVFKSLHPLCDSAAVQALRKTAFIPGQHNGRSVRVRMRLPVRFQLLDREREDSTITTM